MPLMLASTLAAARSCSQVMMHVKMTTTYSTMPSTLSVPPPPSPHPICERAPVHALACTCAPYARRAPCTCQTCAICMCMCRACACACYAPARMSINIILSLNLSASCIHGGVVLGGAWMDKRREVDDFEGG